MLEDVGLAPTAPDRRANVHVMANLDGRAGGVLQGDVDVVIAEDVDGTGHAGGKLAEAVQAKEQGRDARDLRDSVCQRLAAGDELGHRRGKVKDRTLVVLHV